jgi:hypothetical protein
MSKREQAADEPKHAGRIGITPFFPAVFPHSCKMGEKAFDEVHGRYAQIVWRTATKASSSQSPFLFGSKRDELTNFQVKSEHSVRRVNSWAIAT